MKKILSEIAQIGLLIIMILVNILINYIYRDNLLFPGLFILFEIIYALQIISLSEIYVLFLLTFGICYNLLLIMERRSHNV